jgi:hypothetical protein
MKEYQLATVILAQRDWPLKAVDLALSVISHCKDFDIPFTNDVADHLGEAFESLVLSGDLTEVTYGVPGMPVRIKSIYFPAWMQVTISEP